MTDFRKRSEKRIEVLDGLRAIALLFIMWFHIWEQNWITPYIEYNNVFTRYFGILRSDLHLFVKFGYLFVDGLIIISAIVNFLPYARSIMFDDPWPDTKKFYKKRAIRILPSYLLCVLIMLVVALCTNGYAAHEGKFFVVKDILTRITFTGHFFKDTYRTSRLNGMLWMVQVEVIYYLLMPLIAKLFKKKPVITVTAMCAIGIITSNLIIYHSDDLWARNNFFTTFASDYAIGMIICMLYYSLKKADLDNIYTQISGVLIFVISLISFIWMLDRFDSIFRPLGQLYYRFELGMLFGAIIFGFMIAPKSIKDFMGNKVFAFISVISYNLYIWHQVVAIWLKNAHIPAWSGEVPPNELGDIVWGRKYAFIAVLCGLLLSIAITYLYDIPFTRFLARRFMVGQVYSNVGFDLKKMASKIADSISTVETASEPENEAAEESVFTEDILDLDETDDME